MNLGHLIDMLAEYKQAVDEVREAKRSLSFGGSAAREAAKEIALQDAEDYIETLRNQEIEL